MSLRAGLLIAYDGSVALGRTGGTIATRLLLLVVGGAAGCVGSPVPEPPNVEPVDLVDVFYDDPIDPMAGGIKAGPGSLETDREIWLWNLDQIEEQGWAAVETDGSFEVDVRFVPGDEVRFQVRTDEGRSAPVDGVAQDLVFVEPDRSNCVTVPLELDLAGRPEATFEVRNDCGEAVELLDVRWRVGEPVLSFSAPAPGPIAAGEAPGVRVLTSQHSLDVEDILFVELEIGGLSERFPVSVYTEDP